MTYFKKFNKSICVVGLGYVGLPTAALLASLGYKVHGADINKNSINAICEGKTFFFEPNLDILIKSTIKTGQLTISEFPQLSDIYIICVPTPLEDSPIPKPNINHVISATLSIATLLKPDDIVILESTCPVGTTEKMQELLRESDIKVEEIHLAYCPERIFPNNILIELIENSRVVGGLTPVAGRLAADFYRTFVRGEIAETNAKTAEMCKLVENSFRDVNIAFANELSMICDNHDINISHLIRIANTHPRVNILQPGVGVGGHCIAIDPWFIVAQNTENSKLIRTSREVNNYKTEWVIDKIKIAEADETIKSGKKPTIALMGLTFKPNSRDLRESPALRVALTLKSENYDVIMVDPNLDSCDMFSITVIDDAITRADIVCILVKHNEFLSSKFINEISLRQVLDFCGALEEYPSGN